jgi:hypothetical protein
MNEQRLHDLLERAGDSGRARAELEAWPVIRAAYAAERPAPRHPLRGRTALALAVVAVALLVAIAAAGSPAAVAHWLRDQIAGKPGVKRSAPALTHLPSGGRLLVRAKPGVWVVQPDGSRRLLSGYTGATWSPRGLYVAAWRGHELFALEPNGRVHWSLGRSGPISAAAWSPDGYRIAYVAGTSLRLVAGDGSGDGRLRARVAPVAPVWRPNAPHLLLVASRPHLVDLIATDVRGLAWRHRLSYRVRSLAWSSDGRVAAVAGTKRVTILDGSTGRVRGFFDAPRGFRLGTIAFATRDPRLALVLGSRGAEARVVELDPLLHRARARQLFAGVGRFETLAWAPDDRWLLVPWPAADPWLFMRTSRVGAIRAVSDIAGQFDPGSRRASFPHVGGWCCG